MLTSAPVAAVGEALLTSFCHSFRAYKSFADRALAQLGDSGVAQPVRPRQQQRRRYRAAFGGQPTLPIHQFADHGR